MDFDPNDSLDDQFGTKAKFNHFGYSNPKVDELLKQQFEEGDLQKRIKMVHQISDIVTEDAPWAFLVHHIDYTAMHKAVGGYVKIPALRELASLTLS
jgi:oligopeptide transport system substrate-binding protein